MRSLIMPLLICLLPCLALAQAPALNVLDFGAKADATTDDTPAFQRALDEASKKGGMRVYVPPGRYMIKGHLSLPQAVTLSGPFDAPPSGMEDEHHQARGAILLAVEGAGDENGPPFITLH